jgi:hypothetical protein
MQEYWSVHGGDDESWFSRWVEACALLSRPGVPLLLGYALLAHGSAWTRLLLEFSLPEFVRAAEGVLALPWNGVPVPAPKKKNDRIRGKELFRDRALHLVPSLRTDAYVGRDVEALLIQLYKLRSDCLHGNLPFEQMKALGDQGEERAAKLAYLAEVLAREALLVALRHPDWSVFATRDALEAAWASGAFPASAVAT